MSDNNFDIYKTQDPEPIPEVNSVEDLSPDVLRSLKLYLLKISNKDFIETATQKDSASIMNALIDLLKLILNKSASTSNDSDTKKLEEFKKILGGK